MAGVLPRPRGQRPGIADFWRTGVDPGRAEAVAATPKLWRAGVVAALTAGAANTAAVVAAHAAGARLEVAGEPIPTLGFPQMTVVFSLVGIGIAAACRRFTSKARLAFLRVTVALTALSLVPDVFAATTIADDLVLMATHMIAAAIVVPTLARRLPAAG